MSITLKEMACPCCGVSRMDACFMRKLRKAREIAATSFIITSGYRCEKHNKEVGSASNNHTSGHAADIDCRYTPKRMKMLSGLILAGFRRIGIRKDFIHVDDVEDKVESCWLY